MYVKFFPGGNESNPYQRLLANALEEKGIHVNTDRIGTFLPILKSWKCLGKPDIVHLHWLLPLISSTSKWKAVLKMFTLTCELLLSRFVGIQIVWTVHNLFNHESQLPKIELLFRRFLGRLCNHMITHCSKAREQAANLYRVKYDDKISVIPHGHYIDYYENRVGKDCAKKRLGFNAKNIVFLFFGQIRPYKGILNLMEAFQMLKSSEARLLIVGGITDSQMKKEIKCLCASDNRIQLVDRFVPNEEVQVYLNAADIVVLPYRKALTSGCALLAMSFGKPVIAPEIGCLPEVLAPANNLLYDPKTNDGLYNAISKALVADLGKIGKQNLEQAKRYSWAKIAKKTYSIYRECCKTQKKFENIYFPS